MANEDTLQSYNITVNNTDTVRTANITMVNITLPSGFTFSTGSNYSNISTNAFNYTLATRTLSWSNVSDKNNIMAYDTADVANIFNYLSFVEAEEFINNADMGDKTYNFASSVLTLTFFDNTGNIIENLVTGDISVDHIFLKKHNDTTVYMIDKNFIKRFEL